VVARADAVRLARCADDECACATDRQRPHDALEPGARRITALERGEHRHAQDTPERHAHVEPLVLVLLAEQRVRADPSQLASQRA
jgi:hypothetical protein